jgi:hypothetical protein
VEEAEAEAEDEDEKGYVVYVESAVECEFVFTIFESSAKKSIDEDGENDVDIGLFNLEGFIKK